MRIKHASHTIKDASHTIKDASHTIKHASHTKDMRIKDASHTKGTRIKDRYAQEVCTTGKHNTPPSTVSTSSFC